MAFISSVADTDMIFRYHFDLAKEALDRIDLPKEGVTVSAFETVFMGSKRQSLDLLAIRANVLACIHCVRNGYDHFAQLCNILLLDSQLSPSVATLYKVRVNLPQSSLKVLLDEIAASHWFKYVNDFSNTSKHRALVQQSLHLSFADGIAGVRTEAFSHERDYPAYMVGELLEGILELKNQIVPCGVALNESVLPSQA